MNDHDDELSTLAEQYRPDEPVLTEAERQAEAAMEAVRQQAMVKVDEAYRLALQQDPAVAELRKREWVCAELGQIGVYEEVLLIDPNVVQAMTVDQVAYVLRHEVGHVVLNHHVRERAFRAGLTDPATLNMATTAFNAGADLEVNGGLLDAMVEAGLQDTGVVPGYGAFVGVPPFLTAEEYTTLILNTPELWADIAKRAGR
ncbi:MAG: M48 family metalloprotease [bacterium]